MIRIDIPQRKIIELHHAVFDVNGTLAREGVATKVLQAADVLVLGPNDAVDLVLKPKRLITTLRG